VLTETVSPALSLSPHALQVVQPPSPLLSLRACGSGGQADVAELAGLGESFQFKLVGRGEPPEAMLAYLRLIQMGGQVRHGLLGATRVGERAHVPATRL
jgi:hypothetical protein